MSHRSWLFVVALCGSGWVYAAPPSVTQTRLVCIPRDANAKVTARVEGKPSSVRVYFHQTDATCGDYYVDMRSTPQDPTLYTAVLPLVAADATSITYQVHVQNPGGKEILGDAVSSPVSGNCVAPALTPDDLHAANAIAVGLTQPKQSPVPCHFKCNGIVSYITVAGELKPNEECRLAAAGKPKAWYQKPGNEVAIGAGIAGAAILAGSSHHHHHPPPSPARP